MSQITNEVKNQIKKRRTFAIISHPDAGKTTLTEKFLLYGGAINQAGSVKGKATAKHAVSEWMEIEKERGISVSYTHLDVYKRQDGYSGRLPESGGNDHADPFNGTAGDRSGRDWDTGRCTCH